MNNGVGRRASSGEIEEASDALLGHTFREIAESQLSGKDATKIKGRFGELLEGYYGIENNSDTGPDFIKAQIELKCKPLKVPYTDFVYPKEPLSVGHIDYGEVAETSDWRAVSKLTDKLQTLLIVWRLNEGSNRDEFPIIWWQRWSSNPELEERIQRDYREIRRQVREGEHLSETRAEKDILSVCPKHSNRFDEDDPEEGSYVVDSNHPHLDKPQYMSWRLKSKMLNEIIIDHTDLPSYEKGGIHRIRRDDLWQLAMTKAKDATPIERFLPNHTQSRLDEFCA